MSQKEFEEVLLREILLDMEDGDEEDWDDAAWEELIRQGAASDCTPTPEQRAAFEELLDLEVKQIQKQKRQIAQTRATRRYRTFGVLRHAAAVAAVVVIVLGVSLYCTVDAFAASVDRFIATVIPEQGAEELRIEEKKDAGADYDAQDFEGMYLPSWVPKGYQVKQVDVDINVRTLIYENTSKDKICYEISNSFNSVWVDDEGVSEEVIYLFDSRGTIRSTADAVCIVWEADDYVYTLSGKWDLREELIQMAEQCELLEVEE